MKDGYLKAILTQEYDDRQRPISHYSPRRDSVAPGKGSCLRAMEVTSQAVMATAPIVLDQKLIDKCPHTVHAMLSMNRVLQITAAQWTHRTALLEASNLHQVCASPVHPATLLPVEQDQKRGGEEDAGNSDEEHNRGEILRHLNETARAAEVPLQNPGLVVYTNGSSFVEDSVRKVEWAVTSLHEVIAQGSLPA
eukprot:g39066.t1